MMTAETVYYTCLNNDCEKHRSIFVEGDPLHEDCERERLELAGQERRAMPMWLLFAVPAAITLAAAVAVLYRRTSLMHKHDDRPEAMREQSQRKTWSGTSSHIDEREGKTVPPPIS